LAIVEAALDVVGRVGCIPVRQADGRFERLQNDIALESLGDVTRPQRALKDQVGVQPCDFVTVFRQRLEPDVEQAFLVPQPNISPELKQSIRVPCLKLIATIPKREFDGQEWYALPRKLFVEPSIVLEFVVVAGGVEERGNGPQRPRKASGRLESPPGNSAQLVEADAEHSYVFETVVDRVPM
jgi:hypothetical protein